MCESIPDSIDGRAPAPLDGTVSIVQGTPYVRVGVCVGFGRLFLFGGITLLESDEFRRGTSGRVEPCCRNILKLLRRLVRL